MVEQKHGRKYRKKFMNEKSLRVLTWHIHGSYLYYLTQTPCIFYLPCKDNNEEGYGGCTHGFPWGENVVNIVPTDTKHVVDDPDTLLVHVTHFNNLMWDNNHTPTKVIEHGVMVDESVEYTGELEKGIVVINGLAKRGRRLGLDIFKKVRKKIPLDIVGMLSEDVGGLGEINNRELAAFSSKYRFFFNPIRYTSLGLSVCEAMMTGIPIVGLATTEMAITIENNYSGYVHTDVDFLIEKMKMLLNDHEKAKRLGVGAKQTAKAKFNIERFKKDWLITFQELQELPRTKANTKLKI
jgi:glycosyltransferase involved in cell wall biosynthesis